MCQRYYWDAPPSTFWIDPTDKREYCLFHAPYEVKRHRMDFNSQLKTYILKIMKKSPLPCNLCGIIFPHDIRFDEDFKGFEFPSVNLAASVFMGKVHTFTYQFKKELMFGDVTFHDDVDFSDVRFYGHLRFFGADFKKHARFDKSTFDHALLFGGARFEDGLSCESSTICGSLHLLGCTIHRHASFSKSKIETTKIIHTKFKGQSEFRGTCIGMLSINQTLFEDNTDFTGFKNLNGSNFNDTHFKGGVYFHSALLSGGASFKRTRFKDYLSFDRTRFYGRTSFKGSYFAEACHFGRSYFTHSTSFEACSAKQVIKMDRVDMTQVRLFNSPIESFHFICCDWPTAKGYQTVSDHQQLKPTQLEDIYRRLKKSAKQNNDELLASQWHWQEKNMCLKSLKGKPHVGFLRLMLWLYKWISGFGERPLRALMALVIFTVTPLLLLGLHQFIETGGYRPTSIDWHNVGNVLSMWFHCLPLVKASPSTPIPLKATYWFWQIVIALQAALFGFSLRNKLRR